MSVGAEGGEDVGDVDVDEVEVEDVGAEGEDEVEVEDGDEVEVEDVVSRIVGGTISLPSPGMVG